MTEEQQIKYKERKRRSLASLSKNFRILATKKIVPQEVYIELREQISYMERLNSKLGKDFLTAEEKFWKHYNLEAFCESEGFSKAHMIKCKNGNRSYSPRLMETIINYIKKVTV